jgi:hypothetical protein
MAAGIVFALIHGMTFSPAREPTVMWRMERADGLAAHLVLGQTAHNVWAAWFVNNRPIGMREFDDVGSAIQFSDSMQAQNWSVGWRVVQDADDEPPA